MGELRHCRRWIGNEQARHRQGGYGDGHDLHKREPGRGTGRTLTGHHSGTCRAELAEAQMIGRWSWHPHVRSRGCCSRVAL